MKEYQLQFEFFGKKLQTKAMANSEAEAMQMVSNRLTFHSVKQTAPVAEPEIDWESVALWLLFLTLIED